ncbi:tetratricopeptide repeat protein [Treponema zioleckii]|uniref:tetratricopeptide repeat protein n=1 Tax=Treponema zioleckii TaxID=331680 RepID=UPI00168B9C20|nr:tetratricopeptide repeat protein [Treponema zioleckii]
MSENALLLQRTKAAIIAHDYELAARLLRNLIEKNPDDIGFKIQLGNLFVKSGKDEQALDTYNKILEIDPKNSDVLIAIGGIYRRQKKYDDSIAIFEKVLTFGDTDPKLLTNVSYNMGFTFRQMGNYDEAISCFEDVVERNNRDVLAFNHLGAVYSLKGNQAKAISSFQRGLKIDPNHPVLLLNLAKSYAQIGEVQKALAAYEGALRSKPGWIEAIEEYSELLLKSNKVREADNVVSNALKINPADTKMRTKMGHIYNRQSIFDSAEVEFKKALDTDETYKPALTGLAYSQQRLGKNDDAVKTIQKITELDSDDESVLKLSTSVLLSANYLTAANEKLSKLLKKNPDDVETLNLLGQYYILNGEANKTESCYDKIDRIRPGYKEVYKDWGLRYLQIGDEKNAEDYLKVAVAENPKDADAKVELASLYEKQDRTEEAATLYADAYSADPYNNISAKKHNFYNKEKSEENPSSIDMEAENKDFERGIGELSLGDDSVFETSEPETPAAKAEPQEIPQKSLHKNPDEELPQDSDDFDFNQFGLENLTKDEGNDIFAASDLMEDEEIPEKGDEIDLLLDDGVPVDEDDAPEVDVMPDGSEAVDFASSASNPARGEKDDDDGFFKDEDIDDIRSTVASDDDVVPSVESEDIESENDDVSSAEPAGSDSEKNDGFESEPDFDSDFEVEDPLESIGRESSSQNLDSPAVNDLKREFKKMADDAAHANYSAQQAWRAAQFAADYVQQSKLDDMIEEKADKQIEEKLSEKLDKKIDEKLSQKVEPFSENKVSDEPTEEDLMMKRAVEMLPAIVGAIENRNVLEKFRSSLSMFLKLREMLEYLPPMKKKQFFTSKTRILLDYIISKLSGKPGLLATVTALINSGLVNECETEDGLNSQKYGLELVSDVLNDIRDLNGSIEDEYLKDALDNEILKLLEKL